MIDINNCIQKSWKKSLYIGPVSTKAERKGDERRRVFNNQSEFVISTYLCLASVGMEQLEMSQFSRMLCYCVTPVLRSPCIPHLPRLIHPKTLILIQFPPVSYDITFVTTWRLNFLDRTWLISSTLQLTSPLRFGGKAYQLDNASSRSQFGGNRS